MRARFGSIPKKNSSWPVTIDRCWPMLISDDLVETSSRDRGRSSKCELHTLGPRRSGFLSTAEPARRLRQGTADDAAMRAALSNRLLPACLKQRGVSSCPRRRADPAVEPKDASVQHVPEPQLTTAPRIKPEKLQDVQAVVHRSSPESEACL